MNRTGHTGHGDSWRNWLRTRMPGQLWLVAYAQSRTIGKDRAFGAPSSHTHDLPINNTSDCFHSLIYSAFPREIIWHLCAQYGSSTVNRNCKMILAASSGYNVGQRYPVQHVDEFSRSLA